jgi:AcrR family transcriptional regulator
MANSSYHHGDLRRALLHAAESELTHSGYEKLSLRSVARAAGVSHAAPAHHFGDVKGLLTALATSGFERFLLAQKKRQDKAGDDPVARRIAAGLAYIEFSERNQELFHLMFNSQQVDRENPQLQQASSAAFTNLVTLVKDVKGDSTQNTETTDEQLLDVYASWAMVHGLSSLMSSGRLHQIKGSRKKREAMLQSILLDNLRNT